MRLLMNEAITLSFQPAKKGRARLCESDVDKLYFVDGRKECGLRIHAKPRDPVDLMRGLTYAAKVRVCENGVDEHTVINIRPSDIEGVILLDAEKSGNLCDECFYGVLEYKPVTPPKEFAPGVDREYVIIPYAAPNSRYYYSRRFACALPNHWAFHSPRGRRIGWSPYTLYFNTGVPEIGWFQKDPNARSTIPFIEGEPAEVEEPNEIEESVETREVEVVRKTEPNGLIEVTEVNPAIVKRFLGRVRNTLFNSTIALRGPADEDGNVNVVIEVKVPVDILPDALADVLERGT